MICPYAEFRTGLESVFEKCLESCDALELGAGWRWRRWPGRSLLPPAAPTAWRGCARSGACRYWRPSALATESVARHQAQHHRALARHAPALARRERPRRRRAHQPHHPAPGSLVSASRKHPSSGVLQQMDVQGKEGQLIGGSASAVIRVLRRMLSPFDRSLDDRPEHGERREDTSLTAIKQLRAAGRAVPVGPSRRGRSQAGARRTPCSPLPPWPASDGASP